MFTRALTASLTSLQLNSLHAHGAVVSVIGETPAGRVLHAYVIGEAHLPLVSIVAGAHPDEPAGPVAALRVAAMRARSTLMQQCRFAVVPLMDIDGMAEQAAWLDNYSCDDDGGDDDGGDKSALDVLAYLEHRLRRLPGEDREFAWPGAPWGGTLLPEPVAAHAFLQTQGAAIAHLSLHGMGVAHGAWFLLNQAALSNAPLWIRLRQIAAEAELGLHDSPRYGDKGFRRCAEGFCTTPSGSAMRRWALATGQSFARECAFSSMEAACLRAREHGASEQHMPLCAVSEFPLMTVPAHADPQWREALAGLLLADNPQEALARYRSQFGLRCIPLERQVHGMLRMVEAVCEAALSR